MNEVGDRAAFLAKARERLGEGIPVNPVHVPPEPTAVPPEVRFTALDPADLVASFVAMATEVDAVVHRIGADGVDAKVVDLVRQHHATTVVRSAEPDLDPTRGRTHRGRA